jgi:hypothetical protein
METLLSAYSGLEQNGSMNVDAKGSALVLVSLSSLLDSTCKSSNSCELSE